MARRKAELLFSFSFVSTEEFSGDEITIALKDNFEGKILTKVDKMIKEGEK